MFIGEAARIVILNGMISLNSGFQANAHAVQGMQPVAFGHIFMILIMIVISKSIFARSGIGGEMSKLNSKCPTTLHRCTWTARCGDKIIESLMCNIDEIASNL